MRCPDCGAEMVHVETRDFPVGGIHVYETVYVCPECVKVWHVVSDTFDQRPEIVVPGDNYVCRTDKGEVEVVGPEDEEEAVKVLEKLGYRVEGCGEA